MYPKDRLRLAREAAGYESPTDAARAFPRLINQNTLISNENGNRDLSRRAAEKYASVFGVSAGWLLYGEGEGPPKARIAKPERAGGIRRVTVSAFVQAGAWTETWEWEDGDKYDVFIPEDDIFRGMRLFAAESRGLSMNKRYPEGSVIVFNDVQDTQEQPMPGKRYVVERRRVSGECEHTVKLLVRDADGKLWLMPESDDPRFQAAISFDEDVSDGDVVVILGRVVYSVIRE